MAFIGSFGSSISLKSVGEEINALARVRDYGWLCDGRRSEKCLRTSTLGATGGGADFLKGCREKVSASPMTILDYV